MSGAASEPGLTYSQVIRLDDTLQCCLLVWVFKDQLKSNTWFDEIRSY